MKLNVRWKGEALLKYRHKSHSYFYETTLFLVFLGPYPQHMEVPRLGVESELQLPAYPTGTAMPDLSRICDLHHSSRQRRILNPLRGARDQSHILMDTSQVLTAEPRWELLKQLLYFNFIFTKRQRIGRGKAGIMVVTPREWRKRPWSTITGQTALPLPSLSTVMHKKRSKHEPKASVNKASQCGESGDLSSPRAQGGRRSSQSIEALALDGLGPFFWKAWAALSWACTDHGDDTGENPYGPRGRTADWVGVRGAWAAEDQTQSQPRRQILSGWMGRHLNGNGLRETDPPGNDGLKKNRHLGDRAQTGASPGDWGRDEVVGAGLGNGLSGELARGAGGHAPAEAKGGAEGRPGAVCPISRQLFPSRGHP
uniref:Uncharacterized protein n=1 Tax=Sus scrofa TaxID=9823 RepID=A0A8D1Q5Y1_PIG